MVAKSRPRRRPVVLTNPPDPADWPSWVLSFGKGYFPDDPVRQAARMVEFRTWQKDSDAWRAGAGVTWLAVDNERRRRVAVWQETHPEDRGPTFGRAKD